MRTKALVLAAQPPFEGPWVHLNNDEEEWVLRVELTPNGTLDGELSVVQKDGVLTPLAHGDVIPQGFVQAHVEQIPGVKMISVYADIGEEN